MGWATRDRLGHGSQSSSQFALGAYDLHLKKCNGVLMLVKISIKKVADLLAMSINNPSGKGRKYKHKS
jgi:hypothetical protein